MRRSTLERLRQMREHRVPAHGLADHFLKHGTWDLVSNGLLIEYEILSELSEREMARVTYHAVSGDEPSFTIGNTRVFLGFLSDRHDTLGNPRFYIRYVLWVMQRSLLIREIPWMPRYYQITPVGRFMRRYPYFLRFISRTSILTHSKKSAFLSAKVISRGIIGWIVNVIVLVIAAHYLVPLWHGIVWYFTIFQ